MAFELTNKNCVFFNQHDSVNKIRSMREGERSFFSLPAVLIGYFTTTVAIPPITNFLNLSKDLDIR